MRRIFKDISMPKTFEIFKEADKAFIEKIWVKIFQSEPSGNKQTLAKAIWYKYQCELNNEQLDLVYRNKLRRYSADPEKFLKVSNSNKYNIKIGAIIKKNYKGKYYQTKALQDNKFEYNEKTYSNLSSVASEICGFTVSGYDFFGLRKEIKNEKN